MNPQIFETDHEDIIHDIRYNHFGNRIATCSSDQKIKVWDLDENQNWKKTAEWKAHNGSIYKLAWSYPEYGQILASCSFDRSVLIFEEEDTNKGKVWIQRANLEDSPLSNSYIQFAPKHLGLKLATCCLDGHVRIYEATDIINLSLWTLSHDINVTRDDKIGCNSISWNPSPFSRSAFAVATNKSTFEIFQFDDKKWVPLPLEEKQKGEIQHTASINEINWAPNLGRSYHLIATGSKDQSIIIWKFYENENELKPNNENNNKDNNQFNLEPEQKLIEHKSEVWHVEWNVTGTVLASSGDDGIVVLWGRDFEDKKSRKWKSLSKIKRN